MVRVNLEELEKGDMGACLGCSNTQDGVEPDAREYECENCGEKKVFGLEELLIMGELEIKDEEDD